MCVVRQRVKQARGKFGIIRKACNLDWRDVIKRNKARALYVERQDDG